MPPMPKFRELIAETKRSAVHLELRDTYFSNPRFEAWRRGDRIDWAGRASWWGSFETTIADAVARGVQVRRARVVSEPVTDYIRWEHYVTRANMEAGEQVRWLTRRQTTDLLLPGNDFWLFDDRLARVHHFSGDGQVIEGELSNEPELLRVLAVAFERVWARAVPHDTGEHDNRPYDRPPHRPATRPLDASSQNDCVKSGWTPAPPSGNWPHAASGAKRSPPASTTSRRRGFLSRQNMSVADKETAGEDQ